ncbi:unnamed protein product [Larinioides sclopetarius]|uniref:Uncharacterized protein n=1 Tax=Larinioides sclopetarius TaxID=280406 RepID=A0AAV2BEN7_9ARAC
MKFSVFLLIFLALIVAVLAGGKSWYYPYYHGWPYYSSHYWPYYGKYPYYYWPYAGYSKYYWW